MIQITKCLAAYRIGVTVLMTGLLSGCGQVSVLGRTIGESKSSATETVASSPAPDVNQPPPQAGSVDARKAEPTSVGNSPSAAVQKLKSASVTLNAEATVKVASDPKFDVSKLTQAIGDELKSRGVLVESDPIIVATGDIAIDDYALRPTSNAVLFGQIIYMGTLNGTMRIRDAQGRELSVRRIETRTQVSIPAKGETANPLAALYSRFAIEAGNALAGKKPEPEESNFFRPR